MLNKKTKQTVHKQGNTMETVNDTPTWKECNPAYHSTCSCFFNVFCFIDLQPKSQQKKQHPSKPATSKHYFTSPRGQWLVHWPTKSGNCGCDGEEEQENHDQEQTYNDEGKEDQELERFPVPKGGPTRHRGKARKLQKRA